MLLIVFGFCALVFMILTAFSIYNLYNTLVSSWDCGYDSNIPYIYGSCSKFEDNYEVMVEIDNYEKELKDIKCELVAKGGLTSDRDEVSLSFISPNSSDLCVFTLNGEPATPVRFRVTYLKKGFWGYKKFSTIVNLYPDCYEQIQEIQEYNPSKSTEQYNQ